MRHYETKDRLNKHTVVNITVQRPIYVSTHLREVAFCDVIKRQMTSCLTLSGDVRQKLTFKENSSNFARIFAKQWIKIYIFSQQDADHVAGDRARTLMSRMETRASSLIIIPPANCVCGRVYCFHVVRPCVRNVFVSVTFCFFNILKNH